MPNRKLHKKDLKPKQKGQTGDSIQPKKTISKEKYDHKNHWLEEDMDDVVPVRKKKKKNIPEK